MSSFKIFITTLFVVSSVVGVILFASLKGGTSNQNGANLVVWGTIPADAFDMVYKGSSLYSNKLIKLVYVQKDPATFDSEFVEALAVANGPDIVILRDDFIYKNQNKLFVIPYKSFSERNFKDVFIEAGEIFLSKEGIIAVPFTVDPMVMYWNRDLFSNSSISVAPKYWDDFYGIIEKITRKDSNANVLQSAVALGEWKNINNAKEIVSTLLFQAGTPITLRKNNEVVSVLSDSFDLPVPPSQSALNFYTQFSNPTSASYTWNRSLPQSLNMFLSNKLGVYFGFASEVFSIQQKNPNLNFDVTYMPQIRDTNKKVVFGKMYGLSIVKQSKNIPSAFTALFSLVEQNALKELEIKTSLPPVRRDLLSVVPEDVFRVVFYNSALISKSWIDPSSSVSEKIFRDMIESITSGKQKITDAVYKAESELNLLLK